MNLFAICPIFTTSTFWSLVLTPCVTYFSLKDKYPYTPAQSPSFHELYFIVFCSLFLPLNGHNTILVIRLITHMYIVHNTYVGHLFNYLYDGATVVEIENLSPLRVLCQCLFVSSSI